jgi:hypothetical protein
MQITIVPDKKSYFRCSMYYMRKYFGLREIILLALLLAVGIFMYVYGKQIAMLILFAVACLIILLAFVLFIVTSIGGYKVDIEKKGITKQVLDFGENEITVTNIGEKGNPIFRETHTYEKLDKIAVRKKFIYIYALVSVFYYVDAAKYDIGTRQALVDFLTSHVSGDKFKMKKTYRALPKRQKPTLEK